MVLHSQRGLLREHGLLRVSQPYATPVFASKPTIVRALAVEDLVIGLLLATIGLATGSNL